MHRLQSFSLQWMLSLLLYLQFSIFLFVVILLSYACFKREPNYYAVPDNYFYYGELINNSYYDKRAVSDKYNVMVNLPEPIRGVDEIADLAASITASSLTLNFVDYYKQLENIRGKFTKDGWKSFGQSLVSSGFIDAVLTKKLSVSVVVIGTPVLMNRGMLNGSYAWKFQMPILVTYESASDKKTQNQIVNIIFKRIPLDQNGAEVGIAVDSFVTSV